MSSLYSYSLEAVTLAHAMSAALRGTKETFNKLEKLLVSLEELCEANALAGARPGGKADMESEIQSLLVATLKQEVLWYDTGKPSRRGIVDVSHSPLGGLRSKREAAVLQRQGATAGWPDLDIRMVTMSWEKKSLLLEIKAPKGKVSTAQSSRITRLELAGFDVRVGWGLKQCVEIVMLTLSGNFEKSAT